jgi:hypothetical protein
MSKMRTLFVALIGAASLLGAVAVAEAASSPAPDAAAQSPGDRGGPDDPNCEDGITNDGDAFVDADDPDCQKSGCRPSSATPNKCFETNDDDGTPPSPEGPPGDPTCSDGIDNDQDGDTDGEDSDCVVAPEPEGPPGDETCSDGIDNDQDGQTDAEDSDCVEPPAAENCTNVPDHGLLTPDTLGEELYNALLNALHPLAEDPERDGLLSGPIGDAFNAPPFAGTPLETIVGDELACLVDLVIDQQVIPLDP